MNRFINVQSVAGLDTRNYPALPLVEGRCFMRKFCGREGTLLIFGGKTTQAEELIRGGRVEQAKLRVSNIDSGHNIDDDLNVLAEVLHLFAGFGNFL